MNAKDGTTVKPKEPEAPEEAKEAATAEPGQIASAKATKLKESKVEPGTSTAKREVEEAETHWIEVTLKDADGNAVPDELFRLKLPDGSMRSGYTDKEGKARAEGLPEEGKAEINFPRIHGDEWQPC